MTTDPRDVGALEMTGAFDQVDALCASFTQDTGRDAPPLEEYLRGVADGARPTLLRNLLAIEIERRRAAGGRPTSRSTWSASPPTAGWSARCSSRPARRR